MKDALAGLPNVKPNTSKGAKTYNKSTSDYADLMRNDGFWHREGMSDGTLTYQDPMKHRECTLKRFSLLNPGDSLKTLFDRYQGKEREELQAARILPKKMFIKRNHRKCRYTGKQ